MTKGHALWPHVPGDKVVHGILEADIYQMRNGKPAILLTVPGHVAIFVTANVLEMAGGVASGARLRYEDHESK